MAYYPGNNNVYSKSVKLYVCPSDPSVGPGVVMIEGFRSARPATRPMPW